MRTSKALAFTVIALATSAAFAHGDARAANKLPDDALKTQQRDFGRESDPRQVTRAVRLDMTGTFRFTPADVAVKRGDTVRLVIASSGVVLHAMLLGATGQRRLCVASPIG
jgi:plastocyanin